MAGRQRHWQTLTAIRGRDGSTPVEVAIPEHRALECLNIDFYQAPCGRKRPGSTALALTSATFTGVVSTLMTFQPGNDDTASELWGVDDAATPVVNRLAGGTSWAAPTLIDNITASPWDMNSAVFNGCLYMTYKSAQMRLHCWNQTNVRRVGFAQAGAPTVANTGSGSYSATARSYRQAWVLISGNVVIRRGEMSTAVSFTPSASGAAARITQSAPVSENETHWELYGAASDGVYYGPIATVAVATTTYDDATAPSSYNTFSPAPYIGQNVAPVSWRYIMTDGNRLIGAGDWDAAGDSANHNRVWFTPVPGTTAVGFQDHEHVPDIFGIQQNYLDLSVNNGTYITGLAGPINGVIYVFKNREIWKLVPTGVDTAPYKAFQIARGSNVGATNQRAIMMAEDETGAPALYFMSHKGPYRLGASGLQYCGRDVEDVIATMNLGATKVICVALWYPMLHQASFYVATGSNNDPDTKLCFDVQLGTVESATNQGPAVRNGWTKHTGPSCTIRAAAMFASTVGASMSIARKPYVAKSSGTVILKADTGTTDNGTAYQAYQQLPSRHYGGLQGNFAMGEPIVMGSAGSQSLTVTLTPNYGREPDRTLARSFAASGSETRVRRVFEGLTLDDVEAMRLTVGDASAVDSSFTIDAIAFATEAREQAA